ncbi:MULTISPECIES: TIR domain-containing protein [unclassified Rhizobium]|uniref:TIR domain-containing protein n=1 Tax=unclassified Rhizobium TaxID=2613769 RepID=UPI0016229931|nr:MULTISPECIES: TIR domain-containing protein [unclassified Rhizobium]MBB3318715.1 hypothetical protein [Rhizobium sp. BK181]MCS4094908.1 hypothetical protein [Rhizobium sp. BK176]
MYKKRLFISFDYDNDEALKTLLVGQAKHPDSPFELADWSIKEAIDVRWKDKARLRIRSVDVVAVICGQHTNTATGVSAEIAQDNNVPYFLLWGYFGKSCVKPIAAYASDTMYRWTWDNLKLLIRGSR